jgi:hypothetical protein
MGNSGSQPELEHEIQKQIQVILSQYRMTVKRGEKYRVKMPVQQVVRMVLTFMPTELNGMVDILSQLVVEA